MIARTPSPSMGEGRDGGDEIPNDRPILSTVRQFALNIARTLATHGIQDSDLEAEVLLRHVLKYDRARFYASLGDIVSSESVECALSLAERRVSREPLAYITGHREFCGLDFTVSPAVLIPRQETELLVDQALKFAGESDNSNVSVADIGTGSGAIAVSVAVRLPNAKVYATDCSKEALEIAGLNRRRHGVTDRITLLEGDLLEPLPLSVDLIVSNPPYIRSDLLPELAPEVHREPQVALDGGKEGLEVINRLLKQATVKLKPGGRILIEISPEQASAAINMAKSRFPTADISYANDLLGLPRCLIVSTT